jgi:hypothetical protein
MKIFIASLSLWLVIVGVLFVLPHPVPELTGLAWQFLPLPIAVGLLILSLVALIKDKDRILPLLAIVLTLLTTWVVLRKSMSWGARTQLYLNGKSYEATVAKLLSARDESERRSICGDECMLISDSPPRVAFHYAHGFLNWSDIVYDPTGAVAETDFDKRRKLNLYLISAEHLSGDWYLCQFGD